MKCARRLDNAYTLASENIFVEISTEKLKMYENGAEITDLSVSFDGTWLTRGHTLTYRCRMCYRCHAHSPDMLLTLKM
ncbi:hypothetical protein TNCV_4289741, partial [Trichonephila clavipes]